MANHSRREFLRQATAVTTGLAGLPLLRGAAAEAALARPAVIQNTSDGPPIARLAPGGMIQGTLGPRDHGNFEAVVWDDGKLVHFFKHNNDVENPWERAQVISTAATGPGCLIQSSFGPSDAHNFEVVVLEGNNLVHYWRDNSDPSKPWQRAQIISTRATGPGCLIQSSFGPAGAHNFEVVVLEGSNLVHYFHDNSNLAGPWQRAQVISTRATGPGCLIQSSFGPSGAHNFEVVVLEGSNLVHYFHDNSNLSKPWQRVQIITPRATGPGTLIQSNFGTGSDGNFEVVVPEGNYLVHYYHDNSNPTLPWSRAQIITTAATGPATIIQSNFGVSRHGNFEVLAQECFDAVVHYWHYNKDTSYPWRRANLAVLLTRGVPPERYGARKLYQLTGDLDRERNQPTLSQTGRRFGVYAMDLGVSFQHNGQTYFLFGDTNRRGREEPPHDRDQFDSIAYTPDCNPQAGIRLTYLPHEPRVPGISQLAFEVPIEGVSVDGQMYVYFSTDFQEDDGIIIREMGRTVLARARNNTNDRLSDGLDFDLVYNLSTDKFINISVQRVQNAGMPGVPEAAGEGLLIWGSGRYRASDVYLAYMRMNGRSDLETPSLLRYFSGTTRNGAPAWSRSEADAVPLICAGCVGELSVRWNPFLRRWVMMYNGDNPGGINLRVAQNPWGPWSDPRIIFDAWVHGGYGHFMHIGGGGGASDPGREGEWGGAYGPYQIAPFATGVTGQYSRIYFTMSTWNPYQAILMTAVIDPDGRSLDPQTHP